MPEGTIFRPSPTPRRLIKIGVILFVLLTVFFIIISLFSTPFIKDEDKSVTLSYWGLLEENLMSPVIVEFEKDNPNIKINYKKQDPSDYREKLSVRIRSGSSDVPDIFRFHSTWFPMLSDILLPMPKETIEKKFFSENYYNVADGDLIKNGAIYGIPLEIDTLALFINTQMLDSEGIPPPATWQEFIDSSQRLTKKGEDGKIEISGAGIGTYDNVTHAPDIISLLFAQNGVDLSDITKSEIKVTDALTFYTNFAQVENNIWEQTLDPSLIAFSQGKLAMFFGYARDYHKIKLQNPSLVFRIVPVPQLLRDESINIASYWAEGVSNKSRHQKEALLFMKYLTKRETQEKLYLEEAKTDGFHQPFSNKNLAEKLKGTDAYVFVDQAKTAVSSPFVDQTHDNGINDNLNKYLREAINATLAGGFGESLVSSLFEGYSQVLAEYSSTQPDN